VGYRGLLLEEDSQFGMLGAFNALDIDDAEGPAGPGIGVNDPNDALSDAALAAAGFTSISGAADGFDAITAAGDTDVLTTVFGGATSNRLNGAQLTTAVRGSPLEDLILEGILRVGVYHNQVSGTVNEIIAGSGDDDSVYVRRLKSQSVNASVSGNLGARALMRVTDYITLTAGYEVLVLTGVGLGPDQIGRLRTNILGATAYSVDTSGLFVGHGGNVGVELRW
jgi:hypothetical protein